MDFGRVRVGEWVAGASGVALLVFMFFAWYGAEPKTAGDAPVSGKADRTPWEAFGILDIVLALTALMAIVLVFLTASQRTPALPIAFVSVTALLALIATIWLAIRAAAPPAPEGSNLETTRQTSLWLGLLACAGIAAGAWVGMRDESPGLREPSPWDAPERSPSVPATTLPAPGATGEPPARP
jgi:carbon starvation protein CstA